MENRPPVEAHVVQDEALLRVDRGHERPAIPAHLAALHRERHPLGLGDGERAQVLARWHHSRTEVSIRVRDRPAFALLDREHLVRIEIDIGDQMLDRPGVGMVERIGAQVGDRAGEAVGRLELVAEHGAREHIDLHELQVLDAPRAQRILDPRVAQHAGGRRLVVLGGDRRARPRDRAPVDDLAAREGDDDLLDPIGTGEHDERLAPGCGRSPLPPVQVALLLRLPACAAHHARARHDGKCGVRGAAQFISCQRRERGHRHRGRVGHGPGSSPPRGSASIAIAGAGVRRGR